ncbi:Signal transduction histidine kinase,nitrogen specific [Oceanococcus atlanticus]|uniref:Sensory histidine kinase/phosphatase NtrB n=1 Tax=Oceanococcus atlanticus TaxID=1317117 RepID=A0A1Y1SIP1_9GAMM|nr:Signal transduction histidine kinase,nitrogen specific [Oceanococcus atlanticus]
MTAVEALDGLTLAVIALDQQLRVDRMNSAAEVLFGVSAGYACGESLHTALPLLAPIVGRVAQALTDGEGFTERELRLRGPGGRTITLDVSATPVRSGVDRALLLELMPRDRQLRISRDNSLWKQQQISREMIRGLAHEIKNPLGGLRGAAQLLARQVNDPSLTEFTDVIINEADRLQALVDRLLGPNRPPKKRQINIHEVVEHVCKLVCAQASAQVVVERDYDPSLPELLADPEQMIQALLNIGVNALEAVGDEGRIRFRTRSQRQFTIGGTRHRFVLRVDVTDDGPGIPPAMLEQIFYPMVTTRPEGSGLGLAIAQNLVHTHGGLIECDSRPGATTFSIYLPVECSDVT